MMDGFDIPKRFQDKTFNSYDPDNLSNKKNPYEKVREYVDTFADRNKNGDWLVLTGGYGLGKTHLAFAAARKIMKYYAEQFVEENPNSLRYTRATKKIIFVNSSELVQKIRDSYDSDRVNEKEIMARYETIPLLIIDDLGTEKASEWQHEKMYLILNHRYNEMKTTIITTNLGIAGLRKQVSERVVERMIEAAGGGEYLWKLEGKSYRRKGLK
jgi:DNA replication protein DnaC